MKLGEVEKALLAILIKEMSVYDSGIIVLDDGSIIMATSPIKILNLTKPRKDFLTVVQDILGKLDVEKKDLVYAASLCAKSIAVLFATNDRNAVIRLLFSAYLSDEDPELPDEGEDEVNLRIKDKKGGKSRIFRYQKGLSFAEIIADRIHNGNHLVVIENE